MEILFSTADQISFDNINEKCACVYWRDRKYEILVGKFEGKA